MKSIHRVSIYALALACVACGTDSRGDHELDAKPEYSVLQSFEFDYRTQSHSKPYIVQKKVLGSSFDVVGLPRKGSAQGYVWLITNPESEPAIKQMPGDLDFSINRDTLISIEKSTQLAPAVKTYLAAHLSDAESANR